MANASPHQVDPIAVRADKLDLVERLADDLAHEIKNPLHSMVINLEVLKRRISRMPGEGSGDLLRYAGIINGELERVNGRIELLLQMIRPDRAGESVSLGAIVDEVLKLIELEHRRRGVEIDYRPAPSPLLGQLSHETARQLALDLFLTALDSIPAGGMIHATTESDRDTDRLELKLVQPAGSAEPIRVAPARLTIARSLAETLGGAVELRGADERGVSLVVTLPASAR